MRILSFDQALANTGWVLFEHDPDDGLEPIRTGLLTTDTSDKGHLGSLCRAQDIHAQVLDLVFRFGVPGVVLHESPPVAGRMSRPESSLLAALAIRMAYGDTTVEMVSGQRAKAIVAGNPKATKAEVRSGVLRRVPDLATLRPANEHTYDAAALAITYLHDQKEASDGQ